MNLVITGTVATFDGETGAIADGAVYVRGGVIEAVQPRRQAAPAGFADAPRVAPR